MWAALNPDPLSARHFALALTIQRPSGLLAYALRFSSLPPGNEFGQGAKSSSQLLKLVLASHALS